MFNKINFEALSKKKAKILSGFVKTQQELEDLFEEQNNYSKSISESIKALDIELKSVNKEAETTKKIITKITDFLN